jgi:hypothetical protein
LMTSFLHGSEGRSRVTITCFLVVIGSHGGRL